MCLDRYGRCSDQCVHIEEGFRDTPKVRCHKISLNARFESDTSNAYAFFSVRFLRVILKNQNF